jgi:hypothetical protein
MTPAASAQRLLFGTGLGLILASGLALGSGQLSLTNPGALTIVIPALGIFCLILAPIAGKGNSVLATIFPDENKATMVSRVETELSWVKKDTEIGNAWAKLEESVLSKDIEEE